MSKRKRNFIMYHVIQQVWIFTSQKKKKVYSSSNEHIFFWMKTDETIGNPPFLREPPPLLSTNPHISGQFCYDPPLCPNFENKKKSLILRGEETMYQHAKIIQSVCSICQIICEMDMLINIRLTLEVLCKLTLC